MRRVVEEPILAVPAESTASTRDRRIVNGIKRRRHVFASIHSLPPSIRDKAGTHEAKSAKEYREEIGIVLRDSSLVYGNVEDAAYAGSGVLDLFDDLTMRHVDGWETHGREVGWEWRRVTMMRSE